MGCGAGRFRAGLLGLVLALPVLPLRAQEAGEGFGGGPRVLVRTSPESPLSGSAWTLTLLIGHPVPDEVRILAPPFGESFFPDRIFKGGRVLGAGGEAVADGAGRAAVYWTAAEYRFLPNSPGTYTLDSFTVISPQGETRTPPLSLTVRSAQASPPVYRPEIFWEPAPRTLRTGEAAVFQLRAGGRDSPSPAREIPRPGDLPGAAFFMPPVPAGVILEPEAPSPAERGEGLLLRLRVIPLNVSVFSLPARTLTRGNAVFEIPALRVPVLAAPAYPPEAAPAGGIAPNEEASGVIAPNDAAPDSGAAPGSASASDTGAAPAAVPFPPLALPRIPLPKSLAASCETLYAEAKNLWDRAYRAEALAELRRNERDHAAGPLFGALRREAERSLGLSHTAGEKWRPGKPLLGFCLAFFLLALFTAAVSGGRKRRLVFSALFLSAALIFLYTFLERFMPWRPPGVLVRETVVRRIPDPEGAVIARFPEGLPVRIGPGGRGGGEAGGAKDRAAAWVWAEDFRKGTGVSEGWIPAEKLVFYSKQGPISRPGPGN